jgi:hypothetical protein
VSHIVREEHQLRVSENRVLKRIFGPKRDEETVCWRKLYNEELHNLYSSPDIIRTIKSRNMIWAGHAVHMKAIKNTYKNVVRKPEGNKHLEDLDVDGRRVLN